MQMTLFLTLLLFDIIFLGYIHYRKIYLHFCHLTCYHAMFILWKWKEAFASLIFMFRLWLQFYAFKIRIVSQRVLFWKKSDRTLRVRRRQLDRAAHNHDGPPPPRGASERLILLRVGAGVWRVVAPDCCSSCFISPHRESRDAQTRRNRTASDMG